MKIKWNSKYTTIAVYSLLVSFSTIVFYLIASQVDSFRLQLGKYLSVFTPFIMGFVIAYLFNFILEFYEEKLLKNLKKKNIRRLLGVLLTYITAFFMFILFLEFVFPQVLDSIIGIVNDMPVYIKEVSDYILKLEQKLDLPDDLKKILMSKWAEFMDFMLVFGTNLLPKIGNFTKTLVSSIWNIILALIISVYLLIDKEQLLALVTKITKSLLSEERASRFVELVHRGDNIFGKFLSGKVLDSLIVGVLTFVVLSIVKMPYASLIAFIIGVTNIIPFFGPFIGAVPSFFIIVFQSLPMALWFILIIFVIQQIDGNIIGPKILGDSLGISAFWILFSLLIAGKLFGFIGLVIGVPLFVFIYSIIKDNVEARLKLKELPTETAAYINNKEKQ
ncbi:MAG: AI-2E family transporter [Erysipelothrix sp.]|nr:AI-2E family transporter [Erysipelothrix sp.]